MKTTAIKLPPSRRSVGPGRSRFAALDPLMIELFKKYPSRSGRNINFLKALEAEPGLHKQFDGEEITALRSRATDVIEKHLANGNGGQPVPPNGKRKASRFAAHDELLRELFKRFPTDSGKCISFKHAFEAEPTLRKTLGIKTEQDMHSCEQHARILIRGPRKQRRKKVEKLEIVAAPAVAAPAPTANYCWNCGAPHREVNQALAVMARLRSQAARMT